MATIFLFFVSLLFTDAEDDRITILNALDYAIFKESGFNRVFVAVTNDDVVQQSNNSSSPPVAAQTPSAERKRVTLPMELDLPGFAATPAQHENPIRPILLNGTSASVPTTPVTPRSNKAVHPGVVCDGCDGEIIGFRYKCMDCFDFDLCMDCESKMMHSQHIMIRIANPNEIDLCKLKLRKRMGRNRHSEGWTKIDERPTEPKRAHHGHGHHERHGHGHGHGKRHSVPHHPIISPLDLLNSIFSNQSPAQAAPTASSPSMQQSNQSTQVDASLNQEKDKSQTKKAVVGAETTPNVNAPNTKGAPQTSPIAACIQNIPELLRMGIHKAQSAQTSKCPMQGNYKAGLDALADLANNFAVMMDPFAASLDLQSPCGPAPTTAAQPAPASAPTAATSEASTKPQEPATQPESKPVEAAAASAAAAATMDTSEPKRIAAESVLIEDVDEDEDELMRDLLKKMTTFNANAEKKNSQEVSEKTSPANSMEIDGKNSPVKEWTLLDVDDIESVASTSEKAITGTIPKRSSLVTDAASQAQSALKQSEIASTAAYAAVQAAAEAQEKAEQIEYAELSRLLGDHIKGAAPKRTESAPASRATSEVSVEETSASAPPAFTSALGTYF